jgi:bifunctional ADP-heptose synthase (sugar kinase/adenylyltransferase)
MPDYQTRVFAKQQVTDIAYILVTRSDKRKTLLQKTHSVTNMHQIATLNKICSW